MNESDFYHYAFNEDLNCHWINFYLDQANDEQKRELWGEILSQGFEKKTNQWVLEIRNVDKTVDEEAQEQVLAETLFKIFRLYASGLSSKLLPKVNIIAGQDIERKLIDHPVRNLNKIRYFRDNIELNFYYNKDSLIKVLKQEELVG